MVGWKKGTGFFSWLRSFLEWSDKFVAETRQPVLEPKYWPEVRDYMETLKKLIQTSTIDDDNIHQVNDDITRYILDQINRKGSIEDVEKRYLALHTLADRILVVDLNKIVGLKPDREARAQFSEATEVFKKRLVARHQQDAAHGCRNS